MSAPNRQGLPTVLLAIQPNEHLVLSAIAPAVVRNEAQRQSLQRLRLIPAIEHAHLIHHAFARRLKYTDAAEGILCETIGDGRLGVDAQTLRLHSVVNALRAVDQRPAHDGGKTLVLEEILAVEDGGLTDRQADPDRLTREVRQDRGNGSLYTCVEHTCEDVRASGVGDLCRAAQIGCRVEQIRSDNTVEKIPAPVCQRVAETAAQRPLLHFLLFFPNVLLCCSSKCARTNI